MNLELPGARLAEGSFEQVIPLPFPYPGTVQLHLQGKSGENVVLVGQSLTVQRGGGEGLVGLGRGVR